MQQVTNFKIQYQIKIPLKTEILSQIRENFALGQFNFFSFFNTQLSGGKISLDPVPCATSVCPAQVWFVAVQCQIT